MLWDDHLVNFEDRSRSVLCLYHSLFTFLFRCPPPLFSPQTPNRTASWRGFVSRSPALCGAALLLLHYTTKKRRAPYYLLTIAPASILSACDHGFQRHFGKLTLDGSKVNGLCLDGLLAIADRLPLSSSATSFQEGEIGYHSILPTRLPPKLPTLRISLLMPSFLVPSHTLPLSHPPVS